MSALQKGLILAGLHVALVMSLGGKLWYERATKPRVWTRAAPYDPNLPIRGRYVRLKAEAPPEWKQAGDPRVRQFDEPLAFFIPEHVPDPSNRPAGEELWVEVTVPGKGPVRPIRLGVKKDGKITALALD